MAEIHKPYKVGNYWTNLIDSPTGEVVTYEETAQWWDGSPMTDAKVDGNIYRKLPADEGSGYVKRVYANFGQLFLEKDTISQVRALTPGEIILLRMGRYRGVRVNGYHEKGDTPAPIDYFPSTTSDPDNGASVLLVGDLKLQHHFSEKIDVRYFGVQTGLLTEQTALIQRAIDYGALHTKTVYFPEGTFLINGRHNSGDRGVLVRSGSDIETDANTFFKVTPQNSGSYTAFSCSNIDTAKINSLNLIGERDEHVGTAGEWGMGLEIMSSKNISIGSITARDFWGDGIYFGKTGSNLTNFNITIGRAECYRNRRQGISFITANTVYINTAIIENTTGTAPSAAIDFEPNHPTDELVNIVFDNIFTRNNAGGTVLFVLGNLNSTSKAVNIFINNLYAENDTPLIPGRGRIASRVAGRITIGNYTSYKAKHQALVLSNYINWPDLYIDKFVSKDNNSLAASDERSDVISILYTADLATEDGYKPNINIGSVDVSHYLGTTPPAPYSTIRLLNRHSDNRIENVTIGEVFTNTGRQFPIHSMSEGGIQLARTTRTLSASATLGVTGYATSHYNNTGQTSSKFLSLAPVNNGTIVTIEVTAAFFLGIMPAGANVLGLGSTVHRIESNVIGTRLSVRCINYANNIWEIVDYLGCWTVVLTGGAVQVMRSTGYFNATPGTKGLVNQAAAVPDGSTINTLLAALRTAGIIAP